MHDCHVVTYSVSDLSVTSFIGFRSDFDSAYPLTKRIFMQLMHTSSLVLLYFQHTNVSRASIRCHPSGNQLTTLHKCGGK